MIRRRRQLSLAALVVLWLYAGLLAAERPAVRIGIVVDGPWHGNEAVLELTRAEILTLTAGEFDVTFPADAFLVGDWTLETARDNLDRLLADPDVDAVIAWGLLASHTICCYGRLPKPVVAPVVIDIVLQGLPYDEGGGSGVHNLNYVALPDNLLNELEVFREMVRFRKVAILSMRELLEAIPDLPLRTRAMADAVGLDYEYVAVGRSAAEVLEALPADADAVYAWPLLQMPSDEYRELVEGLNARRLPTFSALGGADLELGMLASLGSEEFFPRLTRRIALNLQRILLGEEAGTLPVAFSMPSKLTINMATARAIGVSPTWRLLIEAEVLHEQDEERLPRLSLSEAVEAAIAANLDLQVQRRAVLAGEQEVRRARAAFRPRLDLSALGVAIDDDRAAASFGSQAERTWSAAADLTQLLFADPALANAAIQRQRQRARIDELEEIRLDIALEAAVSYLNVLRAASLVQVQRNNLEVSRSNLDLARNRQTAGAANPAEVFRWESQIATDRKDLIEAYGDQLTAEIALNRLLHRDQGERFLAAEVAITDPELMTGDPRFVGYTETPRRYEAFTDFMVADGLAASPELARIEAAIAAQERALTSARRAYWAPELGLQAGLEEAFSRSGAGSEAPAFDLFRLPAADDTGWSVGFSATLSLYAGGARAAERVRAEEELLRLRLLYDATEERVVQRIRTAMTRVWAAFPGMGLSRQAAAAAHKNLDLVAEAYARGAVSIIDLLDAQAAALNADELAANSVYDFLVELMEAERAANRFDFFLGAAGREAWYSRIDRFFEERGIPPLPPPGAEG